MKYKRRTFYNIGTKVGKKNRNFREKILNFRIFYFLPGRKKIKKYSFFTSNHRHRLLCLVHVQWEKTFYIIGVGWDDASVLGTHTRTILFLLLCALPIRVKTFPIYRWPRGLLGVENRHLKIQKYWRARQNSCAQALPHTTSNVIRPTRGSWAKHKRPMG